MALCRLGSKFGAIAPISWMVVLAPAEPAPLPPPFANPALTVLPLTPRPLSTLDTCALALGTPRSGPPALARSSADCASGVP